MSGPSFWWIDWSLHGKPMRRESAGRFLLLFLAAAYFLAMLLSGGVDRYLSEQYTITAVLRLGVPDEEGEGIARKVAALGSVREAEYRDPERAWKEFLAAYPGLESLRSAGRNPLPGYVEIRLLPGRMSEEGIEEVRTALEPVAQVEKVLSGGGIMPRLLRLKRWTNALLWSGFGVLCVVFVVIMIMQERARAARLRPDVVFLADRGVSGGRIGGRRAAGSFVAGGFLSLLAAGTAAAGFHLLSGRFSVFRIAVGTAADLLDARYALSLAAFLLSAAVLQALASLFCWRAAFPEGK